MSERTPLNKDTIIEVAIKILNTDGLNKLSMRSLADKLEIKASSLYWYFKNKDEVLLYISEYICQKCDYSKIFLHLVKN